MLRITELITDKIKEIKAKKAEEKLRKENELRERAKRFGNPADYIMSLNPWTELNHPSIEKYIQVCQEEERKKKEEENARFWRSM